MSPIAWSPQDGEYLAQEIYQSLIPINVSPFFLDLVRWQGAEPSLFNRGAHREVVETLPLARSDAEGRMDRVVEVAADPDGADARLFGFRAMCAEPARSISYAVKSNG